LLPDLPSLFSAEVSHIQGSFEVTGGHAAFSCSFNIPYKPAIKAAKKAAETAKSKALALRNYMTKPPAEKPTKRITPERVASSPDTEPYSSEPVPDVPKTISDPDTGPEEEGTEEERQEILQSLGGPDNSIFWEPTCPDEERDYADDALLLGKLFNSLDFDMFIRYLHLVGNEKAANEIILPASRSTCTGLKACLENYLDDVTFDYADAAARTLVFYRRHSPQLEPHLAQAAVDFLEGMCNYLLCLLRNAGYHVAHTAHQ